MSCLCFGGFSAHEAPPLVFAPDSKQAGVDAARKLMANFKMVVDDITNKGPTGLKGGQLTQTGLERVEPEDKEHVRAMVRATCCCLLGKEASAPSTPQEALVWRKAARFLYKRIQGSKEERRGREADMSVASAAAMRAVLGQIEAASKLVSNESFVVKDITNQGPRGVRGGALSQTHLKRVDRVNEELVLEMVREVTKRLLGKGTRLTTVASISDPSATAQVRVWAEAAAFLGARIQDPNEECDTPHEDRSADMSTAAAKALKAVLGQMEAAHRLISNREMVVEDIVNAGPNGVKGGTLTQQDLKRVDGKHKQSVDAMVKVVASRLLGQEGSGPSAPEEALVWAEASVFLSKRIQGSSSEMSGRAPDMSMRAATALRAVLADIEAYSKLMSNRETVVQDITNPGDGAVKGGALTQQDLKRVDSLHKACVDKMTREVCVRLLGNRISEPSTSEGQIWQEAATFFNARIQASSTECAGRSPDMSQAAAKAIRAVLATIASQAEKNDTSSLEAALRSLP